MTAAIATGLGIDFAIHLLAHVRRRRAEGASLAQALAGDYVLVARACAWCALALAAALATICLSSAPPLRWFGLLVAAGAIGSLAGALFLVPSLLALADQLKALRHAHAR
jgi:predicted RND superfamily exporter protein